jgi:hypothetical protein
LSNHPANTYRLKVLSLIASLCTLSKVFFHYGFFNGAEGTSGRLRDRLNAIEWGI